MKPMRPPLWFTVIAVAAALPALRLPWLLDGISGEAGILLWLYPFVTLLASWLAYRCYSLDRKEMAWILLALSLLSSLLIHLL